MSYLRSLGVVYLLIAFFVRPTVEARSSAVPDTIDVEFAKSSAVFLGRVVDKRVVRNAHGVRDYTVATLQAIKSWKGRVATTLDVLTCGGDSVICNPGFEFSVGREFVVFATGEPLWVHGCDRTELVSTARRTLRWLDRKPAKRLPNARLHPSAARREEPHTVSGIAWTPI